VLIQKYLPGFLGSLRSTDHTQFQNRYHASTHDGGHVSLSQTRYQPNSKAAALAKATEVDMTGSQEHIIVDLEMVDFEPTDSIHSPSKASTDGGANAAHSDAAVSRVEGGNRLQAVSATAQDPRMGF
jgi:hypothetical protein